MSQRPKPKDPLGEPGATLPAAAVVVPGTIQALPKVDPPRVLDRAAELLASGVSPEVLAQLMDLQERQDAREERQAAERARIAFCKAKAAFLKDMPVVDKIQRVSFGQTSWVFAPIGHIVETATPHLCRNGFSWRWQTKREQQGLWVTCILTHEQGHSEQDSRWGPADQSGKKNTIQQISSTSSYLERYTFCAVTGIVTKGEDDDGNSTPAAPQNGSRSAGPAAASTPPAAPPKPITEAQQDEIMRLCEDTATDLSRLLDWAKAADLMSLTPQQYADAKRCLLKKQAKQAAEAKAAEKATAASETEPLPFGDDDV